MCFDSPTDNPEKVLKTWRKPGNTDPMVEGTCEQVTKKRKRDEAVESALWGKEGNIALHCEAMDLNLWERERENGELWAERFREMPGIISHLKLQILILQGDLIKATTVGKHDARLEERNKELEEKSEREEATKKDLEKEIDQLKKQIGKMDEEKTSWEKEKEDLMQACEKLKKEKGDTDVLLQEAQTALAGLKEENQKLEDNAGGYADMLLTQAAYTADNILEQVKLLNPDVKLKLENVHYLYCARGGRLVILDPDTDEEKPVSLISAMDTEHATEGQDEAANNVDVEPGKEGEKNSGDMSIP